MFLDPFQGRGGVEVAHDEQYDIFRPVEALKERPAVLVALRHVFHIGLEAHGRVLVGMAIEGRIAEFLLQHEGRLGLVLAVFPVHRPGLGLELGPAVVQVLEAIGLKLDHLGQVVLGERVVKRRQVLRGEGVGMGPHAVDEAVVNGSRVLLGAAKHHVFEEVGIARAARLDLVAAAGPHDRPVAHQSAAGNRNEEHPQAVGQRMGLVMVGKHVFGRGRRVLAVDGRKHHGKAGKDA